VNKPAIALLLVVSYSLSAAVRAESGEKCKETVRAFAERIKTENGVASMKSEMEAVVKAGRLDQITVSYGLRTRQYLVRIENNKGGCGYKIELGWFVSALPSECRLDDREFVESLSVLK
jgi:hypothetical protein